MNKGIFKGMNVIFYAQGALAFKGVIDIFKEFGGRK